MGRHFSARLVCSYQVVKAFATCFVLWELCFLVYTIRKSDSIIVKWQGSSVPEPNIIGKLWPMTSIQQYHKIGSVKDELEKVPVHTFTPHHGDIGGIHINTTDEKLPASLDHDLMSRTERHMQAGPYQKPTSQLRDETYKQINLEEGRRTYTVLEQNHPIATPSHASRTYWTSEVTQHAGTFCDVSKTHISGGDCTNCPQVFQNWCNERTILCNGSFIGVGGEFALLRNVTLNRRKAVGSYGGVEMIKVMNQREELEYFKLLYGFYELPPCSSQPTYAFPRGNHLNSWMDVISRQGGTGAPNATLNETVLTIAVLRHEYVNLYHTMTDFYNAFLLMRFFNRHPDETNILFVDAHPKGGLDAVWGVLFNKWTRLGHIKDKIRYDMLVWGIVGYDSLLDVTSSYRSNTPIPLVEEFREFMLGRYKVPVANKLNCNKIKIRFIWRRDYVAHPRNPRGLIKRKFYNENETIMTLQKTYPSFDIEGSQIDKLEYKDQLMYIANADILIGMHGAGLTHALFLPKHATLVELFPQYHSTMDHFKKIALWRQLAYQRWRNTDMKLEHSDFRTEIPADVIKSLVRSAIPSICIPTTTTRTTPSRTPFLCPPPCLKGTVSPRYPLVK